MLDKSKMNIVQTWKIRVQKAGHQLAMLQTNKAIYALVAVTAKLPTMITIQYPKGNSRNKNLKTIHSPNDSFTIKQENIAKKDIVCLRYFRE